MQRVLDEVDVLDTSVRNVSLRASEHAVPNHQLVCTEVVLEDDVLDHGAGGDGDDDHGGPQLVVAGARGEKE